MRSLSDFHSGLPQNNVQALRDDVLSLFTEVGVFHDVVGIRFPDAERYKCLVPILRNFQERLKKIEDILAKYDREG